MLGGNKKKTAPPLKKVVKDEAPDALDLPRPLFRGFIGGDSFITKKGYRGLKLESLWVQNLFEAFKTDDAELAAIALQSSLADVNDRVVGGSFGSPYSIGDYGFYAEKQFQPQLRFLQDKAHDIADRTKVYLSGEEWQRVEKRLIAIANYGNFDFTSTTVGDSFADLAIRQSAFQVAKVVMSAGIDPLVENAEGKDMFGTMKEQYHTIGVHLREIHVLKEEAAHKVMVPSAVQHILSEEMRLLDNFHYLSEFCDELKDNLQRRVKEIEVDKILQRRAQLRNETFSEQKIWNIAQLDKALRYITEIGELKNYIVEKIGYHESHAGNFQSLSKLLIANYNLVTKKDDDSSSYVGTKSGSVENDSTTAYSSSTSVDTKSTSLVQSKHSRLSHTNSNNNNNDNNSTSKIPRSVLSLTGESQSESAASGAVKVGFVFIDDTSVLTEEGQPSRIPTLPYIPNRLRKARIDGLNKHYGKKRNGDSRGTDRSRSRTSTRQGRTANDDEGGRVGSPRGIAEDSTVGSDAGMLSPLQAIVAAARASVQRQEDADDHDHQSHHHNHHEQHHHPHANHSQPSSAASSVRDAVGFSGRPMSNNAGQMVLHRGSSAAFSPRLGTGTSSAGFGGGRSTPSQKIQFALDSQEAAAPLSTKEDLYALLGVSDQQDGASVGSASSVGRSVGQNTGVPVSSAKILAKSMKESYAPILGTLKETADSVILYR